MAEKPGKAGVGSLELSFVSWITGAVVVEASAPRAYPRVTLASTLSESVVRNLRSGEVLPKMFCLVASSLRHLRSQCSIVCGCSFQRVESTKLALALSSGVWLARRRALRTVSAWLLMVMQSLDQENPPYTSVVREFAGGGTISALRMRDLAEA